MLDGLADPVGDLPELGLRLTDLIHSLESGVPPARTGGGRRDRPGAPRRAEGARRTPPSPGSLLRSLDERFAARRRAAAETGSPAGSDPYVRAAAVLHVFDAARLHAVRANRRAPSAGEGATPCSRPRCGPSATSRPGCAPSGPAARKAALWGLGSRDAMRAALRRQPGPDAHRRAADVRALAAATSRSTPDRMSYAELQELLQLYGWGIAADPGLPPFRRGRAWPAARRAAVAMFEHLVGPDFVGRAAGAARPGPPCVDGPPASPRTVADLRGRRSGQDRAGRPIPDRAGRPRPSSGCPFAYLPFDSETLDVREPFTLLLAVSARSSACSSTGPADLAARRAGARRSGRRSERYRDAPRLAATPGQRVRARAATPDPAACPRPRSSSTHAFAAAGRGRRPLTGGRSRPVLLVFDTFEEVALPGRRGPARVLGDAAASCSTGCPQLRVVIAGRTRPAVDVGGPVPVSTAAPSATWRPRTTPPSLLVRRGVTRPGGPRGPSPAGRRQPAVAPAGRGRGHRREPGAGRHRRAPAPARCRCT